VKKHDNIYLCLRIKNIGVAKVVKIKEIPNRIHNEKKYIEQLYKCGHIAEQQANTNTIMKYKLPKIEYLLRQSKNNLKEFVKISSSHKDLTDP
jgi:hypothetical protein